MPRTGLLNVFGRRIYQTEETTGWCIFSPSKDISTFFWYFTTCCNNDDYVQELLCWKLSKQAPESLKTNLLFRKKTKAGGIIPYLATGNQDVCLKQRNAESRGCNYGEAMQPSPFSQAKWYPLNQQRAQEETTGCLAPAELGLQWMQHTPTHWLF